ncbi:MAG TPA: LytTR family DNA-binding domain-containing protein [Thermoanaerobaculia bacterium]|jgi:two-component system LytT family response regulator|nr:LytTR family DNA-binding domain-containing protein [Thermoanaerobaculia bacterium]
MRVLIVDDEPLARRGLRRLLESEAGIEIVGEAGSGTAAIEAIERLQPGLVFLDIQMPEMDGLTVVATIGPERMPPVIFVTAYDQYAIHAFDVNAADYILKPVDPDRFHRALDRVRKQKPDDLEARLRRVLESALPQRNERLVVRSTGKIQFVNVGDIDWINAEDNYVRIHAAGKTYLMRETVSGLEQRLDANAFVRIRRSTIVRVDRIREVKPLLNGTFEILLHDGTRVVSARRFRDAIEQLIR